MSAVESRRPKQLPLFEGRRPDYAENAFSGKGIAPPQEDPLTIGKSFVFVVEVIVTGVHHDERPVKEDIEFVRKHKLKVMRAARMDSEKGTELLFTLIDGNQASLSLINGSGAVTEIKRSDGSKVDPETGEITVPDEGAEE